LILTAVAENVFISLDILLEIGDYYPEFGRNTRNSVAWNHSLNVYLDAWL